MDDYEPGRHEPRPDRADRRLGGLSLQTGASILLIAVIAAVLFLFLGPMPDGGSTADLPTATATRGLVALPQGTTAAGGVLTAPGVGTVARQPGSGAVAPYLPLGGTPPSGTPAGIGFTSTQPQGGGTPAASSNGAGVRQGAFVSVAGTGIYGLRMRFGPGSDYVTIRIVNDGEILLVLDQSTQAQGTTWWRVQDNTGNIGWVDQEFLRSGVVAPASWAPPVASPTFPPTGSGTPGP